jgi:hypothetical protein
MQDIHVATIKFLHSNLKVKQHALSMAAHTDAFAARNSEFESLRNRLCLEIVYAMAAGDEP